MTTPEAVVERVADEVVEKAAIAIACPNRPFGWKLLSESSRARYREWARAAIEAYLASDKEMKG
jgi:hypothetical protein